MNFYFKGLEITGQAYRAGLRILVGTDAGVLLWLGRYFDPSALDQLLAGSSAAAARPTNRN